MKHERIIIAQALNILGDRNVLTADQVAKAWCREGQCLDQTIRYSEITLRECAEQNRQGLADWRLVYILGLSLREQHQIRGTDHNCQPCFFNGLDWWLDKKEDFWATQKPESGYYLIDFKGRCRWTSWQIKENEIKKLGSDYERAHEAIASEAVFSFYLTHQERLLEDWCHWGKNRDSHGDRVGVGVFRQHMGLRIEHCLPHWDDDGYLRMCVPKQSDASIS